MNLAITVLTAIGIVAFAVSGAILAVRKDMDLVGIFVLASITAVGGGVARDVLVGVPPAALRSPWWWVLIAVATLVVFFFDTLIERVRRAVLVFDAFGLAVFCTTSTTVALQAGLGLFESILIGVMGGTAGGVLRDVLAGEIPSVLRRGTTLYVVPSIFGSTIVAASDHVGLDPVGAMVVGSLLIIGVRLAALWRGWSAPAPHSRRRPPPSGAAAGNSR